MLAVLHQHAVESETLWIPQKNIKSDPGGHDSSHPVRTPLKLTWQW